MTTLEELEIKVPKIIDELQSIATAMAGYKKIKTDERARDLINQINGKIKQIKSVMVTFRTNPSFKNHNFDNQVKMYEDMIRDYWDLYHRIKKFEDIIDYH